MRALESCWWIHAYVLRKVRLLFINSGKYLYLRKIIMRSNTELSSIQMILTSRRLKIRNYDFYRFKNRNSTNAFSFAALYNKQNENVWPAYFTDCSIIKLKTWRSMQNMFAPFCFGSISSFFTAKVVRQAGIKLLVERENPNILCWSAWRIDPKFVAKQWFYGRLHFRAKFSLYTFEVSRSPFFVCVSV